MTRPFTCRTITRHLAIIYVGNWLAIASFLCIQPIVLVSLKNYKPHWCSAPMWLVQIRFLYELLMQVLDMLKVAPLTQIASRKYDMTLNQARIKIAVKGHGRVI